jgi:hypothetical protein
MTSSNVNFLSPLFKCTSLGFLVGFLISNGPAVGKDVLAFTALMVCIGIILILWELTSPEPATSPAVEAI